MSTIPATTPAPVWPAMTWRRTGLLVLLAALTQTAVLGWMVWDRVALLRTGREIVLPVTPVDPRSLFRGDYVILGYPIVQVPVPPGQTTNAAALPGQPVAPALSGHTPIYAVLEQQTDGSWQAVSSSLRHPGDVAANRVVLQGRIDDRAWRQAGKLPVRYGIESYFVPEGQGLELEKLVREKKISAVIAVNAKGVAAIKGLMVDGQLIHSERPL